jgi:hypothetical protein
MIKLMFLTVMMGVATMASAQPMTPPSPSVRAQPANPATATPSDRSQIKCADYRRQKDGAWTPRRPVVVGGVSLSPGVAFPPGVAFSGIDVAAVLDARCGRTPGR